MGNEFTTPDHNGSHSDVPAEDPNLDASRVAHDLAVESKSDGYLDPHTGLFVFTAAFLLRRGNCCDSGCRHCPYEARR